NGQYYEPVDLNDPSLLLTNGLDPTEADPRFHQQMVYAVSSETIRRFEFALGREITWRPRAGTRKGAPLRAHLRIFPHAFQQANAFYDRRMKALLFGYFPASLDDAGDSIPGQTVFTCLSHDIIAHETTHAVLDRIRRYFSESTSPDTTAFHEAFADIVALFQHFRLEEVVLDVINRTGGRIHLATLDSDVAPNGEAVIRGEQARSNPLVGLAKQFGESMGHRKALREAIGSAPDPSAYRSVTKPHERGSILVAAVFDAFFTIYVKRTRDLIRIARAGGAPVDGGNVHPDLARRLCKEAVKTATHFLNICIRAIDYCPPVDLQFGEYLRALVTADSQLVPDDPYGYRTELINAFRARGIVPDGAMSYSEDALAWCGPEERDRPVPRCEGLMFDVLKDIDPKSAESNDERARHNAITLQSYAKTNAFALGLDPKWGVQPWSYHPIFRIAPDGRLKVGFVVEFVQKRVVHLDPNDQRSPIFNFRGGSTVIFDHQGNVLYVIEKGLSSAGRLEGQRDFLLQLNADSPLFAYNGRRQLEMPEFAAIHRGY
ncbi:hypothetical protein, partial [Azospirillum sp. B506]|uniref:hypothetical protein n=1 Tax=Azospirillum sp. B506 TaxID=137721 RepID=UPI0005B282C7